MTDAGMRPGPSSRCVADLSQLKRPRSTEALLLPPVCSHGKHRCTERTQCPESWALRQPWAEALRAVRLQGSTGQCGAGPLTGALQGLPVEVHQVDQNKTALSHAREFVQCIFAELPLTFGYCKYHTGVKLEQCVQNHTCMVQCHWWCSWACCSTAASCLLDGVIWKKKKKAMHPSKLVLDALKCASLGNSLWPLCCGELYFFHKYEDVLWIRLYLILQQDPVYYVSKTEARLELSSGGQWFYTFLIPYRTVPGVR